MKILIQDVRTGQYLHEMGGWTKYVEFARDFLSSAEAMDARLKCEVADARLVFRFDREGYSIAVPLDPIAPAPPQQENTQPAALETA